MNRAIASLAVVKAAWETYRRDYIENFIPFIATLIRKKAYSEIDILNISTILKDFREEFGLIIPHHPMLTILDRARKRGIFEKKYTKLIPLEKGVIKYDFSDVTVKKEAELNQVLLAFISFSKTKHNHDCSMQEAQDAFIAFLKNHDLEILFASQTGSLLPEGRASKQLKYLLNAFFNEIRTNSPDLFAHVIAICTGHILANTILYDKSLGNFSGKLKDVEIYFDSRLVFFLLGIEGDEYRRVYGDLVETLKSQSAKLYIFEHTFDEIQIILRNCLKWINSPNYDPTKANAALRYFIDQGKTESDIHQYISTLETKLLGHSISIKASPEFIKTPLLQVDEIKLKETVVELYKRNPYFDELGRQSTVDRDIKSLSAIYHLRGDRVPQTISHAGFVFVTTNGTLAFANKKYEDELFNQQFHVPICLTDIFIGTLVWMQSPVKWVALNEKKMIADCLASMRPDEQFIKKIVIEAEKLKKVGKVDDDEFLAVSRSYFVQNMIMDEALGDPNHVTSESIEQIIQKIRTAASAIVDDQLKTEQRKTQELSDKVNDYEKGLIKRQETIDCLVKGAVNVCLQIFFWILLLIFLYSIVISFWPDISLFHRILAGIVALFFGIISVGYGISLNDLKIEWHIKLSSKILNYLKKKHLI